MERLGLIVVGVLMITVVSIIAVESASSSSGSSGTVNDAMSLMPSDADLVVFGDLGHQRERLGFGDLTTTSPEAEVEDFASAAAEEPWVNSTLSPYTLVMRDWGWSSIDVEWEASYHRDGAYGAALKLRDDLDMNVVESSLEEQGYQRSETNGYPAFSLDLDDVSEDQQPIPMLFNTIVLPEQHLLLIGPQADLLLDTVVNDAESMADTEAEAGLAEVADEPEYFAVGTQCIDPLAAIGSSASPEALESFEASLEETLGASDLQQPASYVNAVSAASGEPVAQVAVAYDDANAAAADVEPRQALLDDGTSPMSAQPYRDLLAAQVDSDGALVRYEFGADDVQRKLPQMVMNFDQPWAYCPLDS